MITVIGKHAALGVSAGIYVRHSACTLRHV